MLIFAKGKKFRGAPTETITLEEIETEFKYLGSGAVLEDMQWLFDSRFI